MDSILSPIFLGQLKNLHKRCLGQFKSEMLAALKGDSYNFAEVVNEGRTKCEKSFSEAAQEACVEGTEWSWIEELELLQMEIRIVADQCRKDETKKMVNLIEASFKYLSLCLFN